MNVHSSARIPLLLLLAAHTSFSVVGCTAEGEGIGSTSRASDEAVASTVSALQHPEARRIYIEEHEDTCDLSLSGPHPCAFFYSLNIPLPANEDQWFDFALQIGARVSVEITYTLGNTGPGDDINVLLYREEPGGGYLHFKAPYSTRSGFILFDVVEDRGNGRWLMQVVRAKTTVSHLNVVLDCKSFSNGAGRCSQFLQPTEECVGWQTCDSGLGCMATYVRRAEPWEYGTCREPIRFTPAPRPFPRF